MCLRRAVFAIAANRWVVLLCQVNGRKPGKMAPVKDLKPSANASADDTGDSLNPLAPSSTKTSRQQAANARSVRTSSARIVTWLLHSGDCLYISTAVTALKPLSCAAHRRKAGWTRRNEGHVLPRLPSRRLGGALVAGEALNVHRLTFPSCCR